jgi:hypothetical protein
MASAADYFEKRVPEAWNQRLAEQAARGAEGAELYAKMRAADFVLTPARLAALKDIEGTMRLEVTGADPWGVVLHFGAGPVPEATTTVAIPDAEFAQLISGALDLQGAFMTGKLQLGGNVEVPMKMAMAIMNPD